LTSFVVISIITLKFYRMETKMKKFFKIIIPIILALAIIACIGWYLFIYDRDFTRDMLLDGARYFDDRGNHGISSWLYDQAYLQAGDNDAVAIELAEQHKADGNFTKAEYTLTRAISDGGSTELYVALCKTYAEQDKLLDVVKLLDAVLAEESSVDPQVKQELQVLRPAAPVCAPEAGFYSQYINAEVSCESGTLFVNPFGEYPSIHDVPYSEPIVLADGENMLYAISVSEEGLVSPLSIFGYTIGGVIKEVTFADAAMEEAIRLHLGVDENKVLYTNDLWDLTYFTVPSTAKDISDLSYLTFVEDLAIDSVPSGQLSYLSTLVNITSLQIRNTSVNADELKLIGSLPKLERHTLSGCGLSTAAGLEAATGVTYLDLSQNTIRDLTPLQSMAGLQVLYLQHNAVNDLTALSGLKSLQHLDVSFNLLASLNPIFNCTTLTYLNAGNNTITSLAGIDKLSALETFSIPQNTLQDITPIADCSNIRMLNISENAITDISALSVLSKMETFDFSRNSVTELPAFAKDCALITIDGSHNQLSSLGALEGLENLNNVFMDYNEELESIEPLVNCPRLVQVKVYGTKVAEVAALLEMEVVVEFDPTLRMDDEEE